MFSSESPSKNILSQSSMMIRLSRSAAMRSWCLSEEESDFLSGDELSFLIEFQSNSALSIFALFSSGTS